ncbi:MAG: glycosyltransferase family 39 protein [Candidatus Promineofilum sp.]|nr:glycosyltransferase family 39 protein [Promineifilum sp.]
MSVAYWQYCQLATGNWQLTTSNFLPVLVLLGAALRLRGLFANTFHADEALFASWARLIAVWRDPLLLTQPVDKPPLLFYSQALFYPLFGPVEWAARLPSLLASLLLIPLTAQLARRLGGDRTAAFIAAAVVAVAPLAVQFSATAFSDPLLTFWLTAALVLVMPSPDPTRRAGDGVPSPFGRGLGRGSSRPFWAGLCLGLALATKYQAALFLPLLVGLAWLSGWRAREWARGLAGLAAVLAVVVLWGAARADGPGLVARQWANVGGLRLVWSWELWPRLAQTARLWWLGLGGPLLALGGAALAGVAVSRRARARLGAADGLLALFVLAYALLHWLWAVPAWDRYLLPVLPIVAALLGRAVSALRFVAEGRPVLRRAVPAVLVVVVALHAPIAANARAGRYPIGGQPAADGGAARVALALADAPYGTVLYDHWYSWHWRYQLFDRRVYVSWFPHTDALLADLAAFGGSGAARYVALPREGSAAPVARRLGQAGYRLVAVPGPTEAAMGLWRIESEATDE